MHDGIAIEKRGKPSAVVCTEPFIPTAKMMARLQGIPDYQFAIVPHPIGSLDRVTLQERARLALPQVLKLLLGDRTR